MQLVQSPAVYNETYINNLELQNHVQIQIILNDPEQMDEVNQIYIPQAENIIVIGDTETSTAKPLRDFACATDNALLEKQQ